MYSSSDNLISNPTYDIAFKDLFGPNGTIIDNQSGQDSSLLFKIYILLMILNLFNIWKHLAK